MEVFAQVPEIGEQQDPPFVVLTTGPTTGSTTGSTTVPTTGSTTGPTTGLTTGPGDEESDGSQVDEEQQTLLDVVFLSDCDDGEEDDVIWDTEDQYMNTFDPKKEK